MSLEIVTHPEVAFSDARGDIKNLVSGPALRHVALITSTRGAIRANHWHPETIAGPGDLPMRGDQWIAVLSGSYVSVACGVDSAGRFLGEPEWTVVRAGDVVYTPPGVGHAQWFAEETTFLNVDGVTRESALFNVVHTFTLPAPLIRPPTEEEQQHRCLVPVAWLWVAPPMGLVRVGAHYAPALFRCLVCGWER